jgi:hypothetical protein
MSSSDDEPGDRPSRLLFPYRPPASGSVHVGGLIDLHFEGYAKAYFDAAASLLHSTCDVPRRRHHLARPCIYLQRHALELLIKDVRDAADDIYQACAALTELRPVVRVDHKPSHDLVALTGAAEAAATRAGYALPPAVRELAVSLQTFEGPDETILRYAHGTRGQRSFPKRVEAPIEDWQRRLGDIMTSVLFRRGDNGDDSALLNEMSHELNSLYQELYAAGLIEFE